MIDKMVFEANNAISEARIMVLAHDGDTSQNMVLKIACGLSKLPEEFIQTIIMSDYERQSLRL